MGGTSSKPPPLQDRDMRTLLSFGLREEHMQKLHKVFKEVDKNFTGVWGVQDMFALIQEPRLSLRAPLIEALNFMGDEKGEGTLCFTDWLICCCSFCALSREEVLMFLFMVIDADRNGQVEKQELVDFFSYVPAAAKGEQRVPVFPVNNKNSLDKFRKGAWTYLEFDGLAQLCEFFPYIPYPAYHTQDMYRQALLGKAFWERLDAQRGNTERIKKKSVAVPGTGGRVHIETWPPQRVTMQDLLDYSRRKTQVKKGKRVKSQSKELKSRLTEERDAMIIRCPLLTMIRNPRCMYHVPMDEGALDIQADVADLEADGLGKKGLAGLNFGSEEPEESSEEETESSEGSYDSEEDEEDGDEGEAGGDRQALDNGNENMALPAPAANLPIAPA